MRIRFGALASALTLAASACAGVADDPISAAKTADQKAYALIAAYAAVAEEAAKAVADPDTPAPVKTALEKAESVASPAVEFLEAATIAYLEAEADIAAAPDSAAALTAASTRLAQAFAAAEGPVAALEQALER